MTRRPLLAATTAVAVLTSIVIAFLVSTSSARAAGTQPPAASPAAGPTASGAIVVIGTGGLSWSDVSPQTPALWSLLRNGATASLGVHSVHANTCPVDGWLTLSAGEQAGDPSGGGARPPCRALPQQPTAGQVPRWNEYRAAAAASRFDASPGLLGDQIASHGGCLQAIGPGAALGAARTNGMVDRYQPYAESALSSALGACPAALVDVGLVRDPADVDSVDSVVSVDSRDEIPATGTRSQQVAAVDAKVAAVLKAAPAGTDVVVASLADAGVTERLRLVAASGPQFATGTLESSSTRLPGLVQLTDLTPTILQHLRIPPPANLGGSPLRVVPGAATSEQSAQQRLRDLLDDDQASYEIRGLVEPFFTAWGVLQLVVYLGAAALCRHGWGTALLRGRLLRVTWWVAVVAAAVPVSTFLANLLPWWRSSVPLVSIVASVGLFVAAICALTVLGRWHRRLLGPLVVVCATTMVVLGVDVMTGSRLQLSSLMGSQPIIGGRFYGMGNVSFALFGTATLLLCTAVGSHLIAVGRRPPAAAAVAGIGLAAVIVDGSPSWGSDFGGPTALLPAVIFLVLAILKVRPTWRRVLAIGGGIGGFIVLLGLLDWRRPAESRSHLGRFVQTVMDGGAWDVVVRKLEQNVTVLLDNPLSLLVPVGLVLLAYALTHPTSRAASPLDRSFERIPLLRPGLLAVLAMWVLGFALNDSGAAIPSAGGTLAVPLMIAIALRALEDDQASGAARTPGSRTTGASRQLQ